VSGHLWEPEHDYYGPEAPYWGRPADYGDFIQRFDSWADFVSDGGMCSAALGLNLLYRWDWHAWHIEFPEDYPGGLEKHEVELFWMMPRKGIMARSDIAVTPADEQAVHDWLAPHWNYMRGLWAPLSDGGTS
jgi:hypothetical protein